MAGSTELLVVDACVAINVRASQRWEEIFDANGWRALMPTIALGEVLYLFDDDGERQPVSLSELEASGALESRELGDGELQLMLRFAAKLGKGEAAAIATAKALGLSLATDDRAAQNAAQMDRGRLVGTPDLIRGWAEGIGVDRVAVAQTIQLIERRARFRPRSTDANTRWWKDHRKAQLSGIEGAAD